MSKTKITVEEAIELLGVLGEAFQHYYKHSKKDIALWENRKKSKGNPFYKSVSEDCRTHIDPTGFANSWLWNVLHVDDESKRNFDSKRIEYLYKLIAYYQSNNFTIFKKKLDEPSKLDTSLSKPFSNTTTKLFDYSQKLIESYSLVRLTIIDFTIPIDKLIRIPLKQKDIKKERLLKELQNELLEKNTQDTIHSILQRIEEIQKNLDRSFKPELIIEEKKSVFIQGVAGSGKTTLLQSITHQLALAVNAENPRIPVFISLRNLRDDLKNLEIDTIVADSIDPVLFKEVSSGKIDLIILIDGYDEYQGDVIQLLSKFTKFKKNIPSTQFIIAGRRIPDIEEKDFVFDIYRLPPFSDSDILNISTYILGNVRGKKITEQLINLDLVEHIHIPLFLVLFLSYVKRLGDKLDDSIVKRLLLNRGELFDKILIQQFLLDYEKRRSNNPTHWEIEKESQIEIVKYIAYYLTITLQDSEATNRGKLEAHLCEKFTIKDGPTQVRELIDTFVHFNILQIDFSEVGFEKKEFRYFFTAKYLSEEINSPKSFIKLKNDFCAIEKIQINDSWLHLKEYLFGLMEPNLLLNKLNNYIYKGKFLLTRNSAWLLYFALEFVDKKNYPRGEYSFIDESFLTSVLKKIILDLSVFLKIDKKDKTTLLSFFQICLLELPLLKTGKIINVLSEKHVRKLNVAYTDIYVQKGPFCSPRNFIQSFSTFNLNISFLEVQEVLEKFDEFYKQNVFDIIIPSRFSTHREDYIDDHLYLPISKNRFSKVERIEITYNEIINKVIPTSSNTNNSYSREMLRYYIKETMSKNTNNFILYFLKMQPKPSFYNIFRVYWFIERSGINCFNPNTETLDKETQIILLKIFLSALTDFKKININFYLPVLFLLEKCSDDFNDLFCEECIQIVLDENYKKYKRTNAIISIIITKRDVGIKSLSTILTEFSENSGIKEKDQKSHIILNALYYASLYFRFLNEKDLLVDNALGLYIDYIYSYNPNPFLIEEIFIYTVYYNEGMIDACLTLLEKNHDNDSLLFALLNFLGRFKIAKAIPQVEKLTLHKMDHISAAAHVCLSLIKESN